MPITINGSGTITGATTMASTSSFATTIGVGGATPSASGAGITFPATSSASSNPNTLDDYEEGTWTPSDGSGAGLTFSNTSASYLKIGKLVIAQCYTTYPVTANTNQAIVAGLPFAVASDNNYYYGASRLQGPNVVGVFQANATANSGYLYTSGTNAATNANLSGGFVLFSIAYIATT
jgi:hypothetical protein